MKIVEYRVQVESGRTELDHDTYEVDIVWGPGEADEHVVWLDG